VVFPILLGLAILASLLATAARVDAATRTWDGGGADSNWSTAANWSLDTLPVAGDTVTFNGTSTKNATIDVPVTIAVFQVNAGYSGTITQSNTLTLTTSYTQAAGTFVGGGPNVSITGTTTINSGGTFNGGSSTISLSGALTVNAGGAFTSTSGQLTVSGAVTLAAGVFSHNGGTVVFSTSNVTLNLGGAATFNNVQFLSGTKTISAANTMTVLGTLTMTAGAVNTGTIAAQGDIAVASTFTGGTASLQINGGANQAWTDAVSATADLPIVNINKPGGTLTMTGTFRTTRSWTWTAGTLSAGSSTVIFAGTQTITGSHALGGVEMRGGTVTIAAGTTLTVTGTLTLTSGVVNAGTLAAQGDIASATGFTGGTTTLLVNGAGAQLWSGAASATSDLPILNFNKPGGTLTITGALRTTRNWTWTAGGMAASGSTVTFAGTQTITGSHTLGGVEVRGGTVTIAAGTILTATGTLELFSGTLNTGTLAAQGDLNARIGFTGGGTATLLINGGGAQVFDGDHTSLTGALPNVDINKPSGTLTITAMLRTGRNWTFTASGGLVTTGSTLVFTGSSSTTITGSHTLASVEIRGGTITIAAGTTLTATGSVNLVSGSLSTGTLAAQGSVDVQIGYTGGGTATLLINGGGAQTLTGFHTTAAGSLPNLDINKSAGTLTIAGTLRTARNWTWSAGVVSASGSTVIFNGTQTIAGSHALGTVEIRGGTITIAAGTTLTAGGSLNLFSGVVNGGTLAVAGDVTAASGFTGGNSTLLINGGGAQLWTGGSIATSDLPLVIINKGGGTLTMSGTFRTTRNWTWLAGTIAPSGSTVTFAGTQTITGSHALDGIEIRGAVTIAAGTTLTAGGSLNLFSGSLSTGILAALGNIDARIGYTGGGTATLLIAGTGPQTMTGFHTTLTGSLPNVDINKSAGTLTLVGILRTARNWTYTAGGLSAAGSTLVFNGTQTVTGSHTLDNVEVRGGALTIAAGTTLTVTGSLNLFSGSLSTGILAAQGNIDARIGYTGGGTATLLINGTGSQTITGFQTAAAGSLPNVTIDKSSGTLTIAGTLRTARNWTYVAGGLSPGGSTIIFNGTLTVSGDHSLDAVELHAGDVTVNPGDTLTVNGLLTLTDGNLNGGTIDARGDISLLAGFDGETGTIRVAGAGNQTWTGSANTTNTDLPNIVIDKPSGTLFLVGTFRMITSSWTWLSGTLDPGASTVHFDASVTINGTHSLYGVYLSGGTHTVGNGDTLTALGGLTLDNGTIDGGTIAAAGSVQQFSTFDGGTGLLQFTGASNRTFTGSATSAAGDLPAVEIAASGGTLTLAGTIRTTHDWTHSSGTVDPGNSLLVFAGSLTIDAGTMSFHDVLVNAGASTLAANLIVANDLTVSGGALAIGSNAVFVAGDVTINGGLTVTAGSLTLDGGSGQLLGGSAPIGLYDLNIADPAGVTQTTAVAVAGVLDLAGPLDFSGQSLTIAHAIAGVPNDLTADATSSMSVNGSGIGVVIPSSLSSLLDLGISNPNGAALAGGLTVEGTLTLAGGNVDAGSAVLSIGPAGLVNRTTGHVVGALQKWIPTGSGVAQSYEIGDATTYAPLGLTFGNVAVSGQLTAFTIPAEHPAIGSSPIYGPRDVNRWWSLANSGVGFDTLAVTFTFAPGDVDPGAQTSQFIVAKWDGAWTIPTSGSNTATSITASGITSLSEFAVGEPAIDLMLTKAGPASAVAGDPAGFDYILTVHNGGASDNAGGFAVSDSLPAGLTFQSSGSDSRCLAVGQTMTCTNATGLANGADDVFVVHVRLASTAVSGTILSNVAVVGSANDPDASNDTSNLIATTVATSADIADLVVDSPDPVVAGGTLTYTITVTNLGPSDALNVVVTDLLSPSLLNATYCVDAGSGCGSSSPWTGALNLGTLAADASVEVVITASVDPAVPDGTTIANQASAGAATPDPDNANNTSSSQTQVSVIVPATPVPTPAPTPAGSLADTGSSAWGGDISPLMLLAVIGAWMALVAALAAESAWRRRARS